MAHTHQTEDGEVLVTLKKVHKRPAAAGPVFVGQSYRDGDVVDQMMTLVSQRLPVFRGQLADLEVEIRQRFGGDKHYIARRSPGAAKDAQRLARERFNGANIAELARDFRVTERTIRNWVFGRQKQ